MARRDNLSLPEDSRGNKFFSATKIVGITNVDIDTSAFLAITVPAGVSCKAVHVTTRDAADFLLSDIVAGTTYATLNSGMYIDIAGAAAATLFWVKGSSDTFLEVIFFD